MRRQLTILYWRWGTKAWDSKWIRYPRSPCRQRWMLIISYIENPKSQRLLVIQLTRQTFRLESKIARFKLKGIGGGLNKRWSMWFNATTHAKPYQICCKYRSIHEKNETKQNIYTKYILLSCANLNIYFII